MPTSGRPRRASDRSSRGASGSSCSSAAITISVLTTAGIIAVLGVETFHFFRKSGVGLLDFLTGTELRPDASPPRFGILPLIWGTFVVAAGSSLVALPIGLLSAIYLSEYAPRRVRGVLKPALELLAGIPSIVYGYLALLLVTPALKAVLEPLGFHVETFNALSACIVVGVMIIPMVSSLSEDVLSAVPRGLARGRLRRWGRRSSRSRPGSSCPPRCRGSWRRSSWPISRAIGETMAVVLAAGMRPQITLNPLTSVETMTAYIVAVFGGEASYGSPEYLSLFAVGMSLFVITLTLNIISGLVLRRYREVYQ